MTFDLNSLIGVTHHGDEKIDQDDGGCQEIDGVNKFEKLQSPEK